jgi:ectoine hydroxylase
MLSKEELTVYDRDGYLLRPGYFSTDEVKVMRDQLDSLFNKDKPEKILETSGKVRSVYGIHTTNEVFSRLVRHPGLLRPAMEILKSEVYVYQFKINAKVAMFGDVWAWHQDFIFWKKEDGLPEPRVINVSIFLDEVTEFNGPMMIIPGSHKSGMVNLASGTSPEGSQEWPSDLAADLKYSLGRELVAELVKRNGIIAPKGPAGSVLFFDANVFHGSSSNMSPFNRAMAIVTYNSTSNVPSRRENARPEFLVATDHSPLQPLAEDCLKMAASCLG